MTLPAEVWADPPSPAVIPPRTSLALDLQYTPLSETPLVAAIYVQSDDLLRPNQSVPVLGPIRRVEFVMSESLSFRNGH